MTRALTKADRVEMQCEQLRYVQTMLGELRTIAQSSREGFIAYLIEMAYVATGDKLREMYQAEQQHDSRDKWNEKLTKAA